MKAAILHKVGEPLTIEDVQISKPGPREVLVKTAATGVCHSDLHFVKGLSPMGLKKRQSKRLVCSRRVVRRRLSA